MKIIGEIPARYGSRRVKNKNLRILNGKPMIAYAIEAARNANRLDSVFVNTESPLIGEIAKEYGVEFFRRSPELASDTALQEEFNYDFIKKTKPDVLVMVNPVSPLITSGDIDDIVDFFITGNYDTVITVEEIHQQAFHDGNPINIDVKRFLQPTQDIVPIHLCAWSVTIWRASVFVENYEKHQFGAFSGKMGFFPLERRKCLKISDESDFQLAEMMMKSRGLKRKEPEYHRSLRHG